MTITNQTFFQQKTKINSACKIHSIFLKIVYIVHIITLRLFLSDLLEKKIKNVKIRKYLKTYF